MDHSCRRAALPFGLHAVRRSHGKRTCEESVPARAVHRRRRAVEGSRGDGGVFESRGEWSHLNPSKATANAEAQRSAENAERTQDDSFPRVLEVEGLPSIRKCPMELLGWFSLRSLRSSASLRWHWNFLPTRIRTRRPRARLIVDQCLRLCRDRLAVRILRGSELEQRDQRGDRRCDNAKCNRRDGPCDGALEIGMHRWRSKRSLDYDWPAQRSEADVFRLSDEAQVQQLRAEVH